jgi:3,4-dihydroxy 2-butanone 4-phosphate synthase
MCPWQREMSLEKALRSIKDGRMVLVYDFDDREKETDMMIASQYVTPEVIRTMRKDAGGLICTITPYDLAMRLGLPYLSDVFSDEYGKYPVMKAMVPDDIRYDKTKSSFGITINHRHTYTGITDRDRALTITEYVSTLFSGKADAEIISDLGKNFRAPGHIHLLNSSKDILKDRKGHTELCSALLRMAGAVPSATICEMLGDDGGALSREGAKAYAERNGLVFVEGREIEEAWNKR